MNHAAETIRHALDHVKVVDPHCHLRLARPTADHLADIVLYHHVWIELVSSGMGAYEVSKAGLPHEVADPDIPPDERLRRCLPHLRHIRTTTLGLCLRWILQDLYGLPADLTEKNLDEACRVVADKVGDPGWADHVLRGRCGIEHSVSVEPGGKPFSRRMHRGREWAPVTLLSGKKTPQEVLASYEKDFGREIHTAADYADFIARGVARLDSANLKFLGLWVLPFLTDAQIREQDTASVLRKVKANEPLSHAEVGGFGFFGVCCLLEALRKTPLRTIQVIVGAEVLPPHRSVTYWSGQFTGAIARIAGQFEDFHFNLSSASDLYTQDLGILAKHIPNISVAGYWWHTLYPFYIRKSIETRLDMIPMNKIVAYFSDAYHAEWCYPKLKLVKALWADVLRERVEKGWLDANAATDLIHAVFWENPKRIYGCTEPASG